MRAGDSDRLTAVEGVTVPPEPTGAAPKAESIQVIAICVFGRDDNILVFDGFDSVKGLPLYRPLGGGIEPGETSQEAVAREIHEELGLEVTAHACPRGRGR